MGRGISTPSSGSDGSSGGQISAGQAGLAGGGHNLVEAVRQLFGEAGPRQVAGKSNALECRPATGKGTVYTYTITHRPPEPFRNVPPYIVATVDWEEGVRIMRNLVNCAPDQVHAGLPVRLTWVDITEEFRFPVFAPGH